MSSFFNTVVVTFISIFILYLKKFFYIYIYIVNSFVRKKVYLLTLLRGKKRKSCKSFSHLNVPNKIFISVFLCPYYRYIWGECKDTQKQGHVNHVFCLGGAVCTKLFKNGTPIKLYHMNDIPDFPSESSIEN